LTWPAAWLSPLAATAELVAALRSGFAEAGAAVAIFGRNDDKNQQVLAELKSIGAPSMALKVDMTDRAGLQPALNRVESELGSVSILVNNAGNVSLSGGVLQEKPEDWDNVIETQLNSVFLLSKLAAASMVRHKFGKIINIGSMYGCLFGFARFGLRYRNHDPRGWRIRDPLTNHSKIKRASKRAYLSSSA
jgi:NAD(P)-dependent dehydrogenase (short-subunit alcohol dehydrogenase family)